MTQNLSSYSWTTQDILQASSGKLLSGSSQTSFSGFFIDSRRQADDSVFIAIKGEVHDGHRFVHDVIQKGVRGVMISADQAGLFSIEEFQQAGITCFSVEDTTQALGHLAKFHRRRAAVPVIAVTGSNGKTSTRELIYRVLSQRFNALSAQGSFNNHIGMPLTLLKLNRSHEMAVVELGMNHFGEIAGLTRICEPDIGVITNIGPAHLEGVCSLDGVMQAKGELLEQMKSDGTAILNADDSRIMQLSCKAVQQVILYGFSDQAAVKAKSLTEESDGVRFEIEFQNHRVPVRLKTPGRFMVSNALAAVAVGFTLQLSATEIVQGLESFVPVKGRMNVLTSESGVHIIDDTYNANPGSMTAAMTTFASMKGNHRGIMVIGEMRELGSLSEELHRQIGMLAGKSDIARLYATGTYAGAVISGAIDSGLNAKKMFTGSKEEIVRDLKEFQRTNDWVLIKGSRASRMEEIVEKLLK